MRWMLATAAFSLLFVGGCDRTIKVDASPDGTERLQLRGDLDKEGTITRPLDYGDRTLAKGTRVIVRETWIIRRGKQANPRGYRVDGHYDATKRSDGFVLPSGKADIYFVSALLPQSVGRFPIPIEAFRLDP